MEHEILLDGRPRKPQAYLRAVILPRKRYRLGDSLPRIRLTVPHLPVDERHVAWFRSICGYDPSAIVPADYPLSLAFHYHLGVFAHSAFPWSLKTMLGLSAHVMQHRRLSPGESLALAVATEELRVRRNGVEFDLHTRLSSRGEPVWESTHVYFMRGNFGHVADQSAGPELPPMGPIDDEVRWSAPRRGGLEFARLCGDFNPLHWFSPWARALGFERVSCHTQRIVAASLLRLPEAREFIASRSLRLDVAFKGPVPYGSALRLQSAATANGRRFDLHIDSTTKPAMVGRVEVMG